MSKPRLWRIICLVSIFCGLAVVGSPADTFTTIARFDGLNGASPCRAG
jgi:hypothetical protein